MSKNLLELSRHCKICQNLDFDISYGTRCGLTNERPNFESRCEKIDFGGKAENYIIEISVEKELINRARFDYIGTFIMFLIISLTFIVGGALLTNKIFGFGIFHTATLVLMGIGLLALPKAFGALKTYRAKKEVADQKIKILNDTLNKYGKKYEIDLEINEIHGINEIKSNVRIY